ncbi:MAG: RloB domain-containing protein [Sulfuritalea sp.]|nr:RloB domain-containing protein [Sulfuritalea sp.]
MGQDNQPKHRQETRDLKRRAAQRAPYKRMLVVCEGEKTEPHYLGEIRQEHRLATANVQVWPSALGTQPLQVVNYAESLFRDGDGSKGILPKAFDHVCAVFDRDDHGTYHNALARADSLNGKLKNDAGEGVAFQAIASVPCFELWLLLHFEDIHAPIGRDEVYARLRCHLPAYDKGQRGYWAATKDRLEQAVFRAEARAVVTTAYDGNEPYTGVHKLILLLTHLKD